MNSIRLELLEVKKIFKYGKTMIERALEIYDDNIEGLDRIKPEHEEGEVLWVREDFEYGICPNDPHGMIGYRDSSYDFKMHSESPDGSINYCRNWKHKYAGEMEEWASRLTVEVNSVSSEKIDGLWAWNIELSLKEFTANNPKNKTT